MRPQSPSLSRNPLGNSYRRHVVALLVFVLACAALSFAQEPKAQLPHVYIDTTWNPPTGGTTWAAHSAAQLTAALSSSQPGDIIVLDAGATYSGNFQLQAKTNPSNKWIYIMSSAINSLTVGVQVSPAVANYMAKIVTPNAGPGFQVDPGANHWRLAGLEITAASNYPSGCPNNGVNCLTYFLMGSQWPIPTEPDSVVVDRSYLHGGPTQDLQSGWTMNCSNCAIIDSYVSEVHNQKYESQAVAAYHTPGPLKIVDNYLSAAGENIMFGGSGGNNNAWVPSDIEIRNNYIYKPLSWVPMSLAGQMVVKNAFECKACQRVLFDGNIIENVWAAGQKGYAIVLTVRTSQSGDIAVVNDITVTNNTLNNVVSFVNTLGADDQCGPPSYPKCKNAGSQDRWNIANNAVSFYDPTIQGGSNNLMMAVTGGYDHVKNVVGVLRDVVFQSNTYSYYDQTQPACWNSIYFSSNGTKPPWTELTNNIWILNNSLCRQPTGDYGYQGTQGLQEYMGYPGSQYDYTVRFQGNSMAKDGGSCYTWPASNTCF